jgi:hypothetical protein
MRKPFGGVTAPKCFTGLVASLLSATGVSALEYSIGIETGVGYSDNAARARDGDEASATLGLLQVTTDLEQTTQRLTAFLRSDLQFATYSGDRFDDETIGGVDLAVDYSIVPRILAWIFVETFGQEATDPFRAVSVFNREDVKSTTPRRVRGSLRRLARGISWS